MEQEEIWDALGTSWRNCRSNENPHVVEFLENKEGKILDLGCGSGRNFVEIEGLDFYGVDFSKEMIRIARMEKIAKEIRKASADNIPYDDEFFNFGLYIAVLHCVDSSEARRKSLEELFRVLKSGGEALISVWSRNQDRVKNKPKEALIPWTVGDKKYERYYYLYDLVELEGLLKSVGFEVVRSWERKNIWFVVRKK